MAFVILSAGPLSQSRLRTIDALPLAAIAGVVLSVLMAGCVALGYNLAHITVAPAHPTTTLLDRPDGRAVIDRIGTLSGRLTQLESQTAVLAKRLGATPAAAGVTLAAPAPDDARPAGGPFVPLADLAAISTASALPANDLGTGLSPLETELSTLSSFVDQLEAVAIERDLRDMAYPNRQPIHDSTVSSGFGVRRDPFTGRLARHTGIDVPAPQGTPVLASAGGRVQSAGRTGAYGNAVVIDHGNGLSTLYGHLARLFVRAGDSVMPRQKIATVGSTGRSTGPHLHFEVIRNSVRVEPRTYLAQTTSVDEGR